MRQRQALGVGFVFVVLLVPAWGCGGGGGAAYPTDGGGGFLTFQPAALVIGQTDFASVAVNRGGAVAAGTLNLPLGKHGGSLFVSDQNNHRVLGFAGFPAAHGEPASFALGQPDLLTAASGTGASNFNSPTDLSVDGSTLAVADWANNRVLVWDPLPTADGAPAHVVVGQTGFGLTVAGSGAAGLSGPGGVFVAGGMLFVADQLNHRVLIWNTIPSANGVAADVAVGQPNLISNAAGTSVTQLRLPLGLWSDGVRLVVADTGNNRVLIWNAIPTVSGVAADIVVGQATFGASIAAVGPQNCSGPVGVTENANRLYVSDRLNNRVLIFDPFPDASNPAASAVLGQGNFTLNAANDDDEDGATDVASARTMNNPGGLSFYGGDLLVTDQLNSRVLVFAP